MFPTADQIAIAVVRACRLTGNDPIRTVSFSETSRGRFIAMAALLEAFPDARRIGLGQCLRFPTPRASQAAVITARKQKWWRDDWVDEIVGVLVSDQYDDEDGEASEPKIVAAPAPKTVSLQPEIHFDQTERRLISRMWSKGANAACIGAAIGADGDMIRMFAKANPHICPARGEV
ncbi:hypothetical protein [Pseudaminobacter salicylatoxidans]|uniref:hypothetical protein n=1 Tax=Pseudaminobacter salicylatoxidans TaxID=93369 RepID=UPI000D6B94B7|nr:hypothetical protein [Pseudaminobacter salicylatoxidans]